MYLSTPVEIPSDKGKISHFMKDGVTYYRYLYGRRYDPKRRFALPNYRIIGKGIDGKPGMMLPNENYIAIFGTGNLPENMEERGCFLRIGSFLVIRKAAEETKMKESLEPVFGEDAGFVMDLAAYSIVTEDNAGQYYPDYAYEHPLFTEGMKVCSDSKVSDFLSSSVREEQRREFLNLWNEDRDHRQRIYVSYDSTNKNCEAGDLEMVEYGHPKTDAGEPVVNISVAYDASNEKPLFYEEYPGSIVDVSQLCFMVNKANGYGYKNIGFILDRGYFSEANILEMDSLGYGFVMMFKGKKALVRSYIDKVRGIFENSFDTRIQEYGVNGTTLYEPVFPSDVRNGRKRYIHLYYSDAKASSERRLLWEKIARMTSALEEMYNREYEPEGEYLRYFDFVFYEQKGKDGKTAKLLQAATAKKGVIEEELSYCGYYAILTSEKKTAEEALTLYKSRDVSEKLFRDDKTFLGGRSLRVYSDNSAASKLFIGFLALILRNKIYTVLKDATDKGKKENFMDVPAAVRELEKIALVKDARGDWIMDYAITKTQKTILRAFGFEEKDVRKMASELGRQIADYDRKEEKRHDTEKTDD